MTPRTFEFALPDATKSSMAVDQSGDGRRRRATSVPRPRLRARGQRRPRPGPLEFGLDRRAGFGPGAGRRRARGATLSGVLPGLFASARSSMSSVCRSCDFGHEKLGVQPGDLGIELSLLDTWSVWSDRPRDARRRYAGSVLAGEADEVAVALGGCGAAVVDFRSGAGRRHGRPLHNPRNEPMSPITLPHATGHRAPGGR